MMIRPASASDVGALFPIVQEFATSFVPEFAAFEASVRRILDDPSACLLLAEDSGLVVGYVFGLEQPTLFANGPMSVVHEIAVTESLRRCGVGRALMAAFEEWARSLSCLRVGLATRRADAFYRALGYEQFSTYFRKLL